MGQKYLSHSYGRQKSLMHCFCWHFKSCSRNGKFFSTVQRAGKMSGPVHELWARGLGKQPSTFATKGLFVTSYHYHWQKCQFYKCTESRQDPCVELLKTRGKINWYVVSVIIQNPNYRGWKSCKNRWGWDCIHNTDFQMEILPLIPTWVWQFDTITPQFNR